jgi:hypothetical protein
MTRFCALMASALSFSVLVIAGTAAAEPKEIPISGCNSQMLANGAEVFWTSSFATDDYTFAESSRSGEIVTGQGDTLEVTVQWSTSEPQTESSATGFGPRGAGFSPGGVGGEVEFNGVVPHLPLADPGQCEVHPEAPSYNHFTFTLKFTSLHKPARRGGGIAKGNAQFEVDVAVGGEVVSLGTNVHVATGTDPDA